MSLVIELPPIIESRLEAEAEKTGLTPEALVAETMKRLFSPQRDKEVQREKNQASISLLESWLQATPKDPQAMADAEADLKEFKDAIDQAREVRGLLPLFVKEQEA